MKNELVVLASALAMAASFVQVSKARELEVTLRPQGETSPRSVALGQGSNLPPMPYHQAEKVFKRTVSLDHVEPRIYDLVLSYDDQSFVLPVRLHRNSEPINLAIHFDGPEYCLERLVQEAERPAQSGNIPQALRKYLLAAHLSEIDDDSGRCRDSQPARLRKARISRGIQLATFRGSPFMPPENDESEWASILGEAEARIYSRQVRQAEAILLSDARQSALAAGNYQAASEVNALLVESSAADADTAQLYSDIGLTQRRLEDDRVFIDARAAARLETSTETAVGL